MVFRQHHDTVVLSTDGSGLYEFTGALQEQVVASGIEDGICHLLIQHTSASLTIQENADPSARADLEEYIRRIAPEGEAWFQHTLEGPDDMPAHLRAALTDTTLSIPVQSGQLRLGTWQGVYLWEHRARRHRRSVAIVVIGE